MKVFVEKSKDKMTFGPRFLSDLSNKTPFI